MAQLIPTIYPDDLRRALVQYGPIRTVQINCTSGTPILTEKLPANPAEYGKYYAVVVFQTMTGAMAALQADGQVVKGKDNTLCKLRVRAHERVEKGRVQEADGDTQYKSTPYTRSCLSFGGS